MPARTESAARAPRSPLFRIFAAGFLLLLLLLHAGSIAAWCCRLLHTLRPLLLGVLFATMLNPAFERLRTDFSGFALRHGKSPDAGWIRTFSLPAAADARQRDLRADSAGHAVCAAVLRSF